MLVGAGSEGVRARGRAHGEANRASRPACVVGENAFALETHTPVGIWKAGIAVALVSPDRRHKQATLRDGTGWHGGVGEGNINASFGLCIGVPYDDEPDPLNNSRGRMGGDDLYSFTFYSTTQ